MSSSSEASSGDRTDLMTGPISEAMMVSISILNLQGTVMIVSPEAMSQETAIPMSSPLGPKAAGYSILSTFAP